MGDTTQPRLDGLHADWGPMLLAPATPPVAHLADEVLLRQLTRAEDKHVVGCGWCRERQQIASVRDGAGTADGTDEEFERALDESGWEASFPAAAAGTVLPSRVRRLMTVSAVPDEVAAGQLWRLTWRAHHLLAAVIAVDGWQVLVAPVTTDVDLADELTLLVPADRSPVDVELAVRVRQRLAVPLFVLDRYLGPLPAVGDDRMAAAEVLDALVRAHRTDSSDTAGLAVGQELSPEDVDAIAFADAIAEEAAWFAAAARGLHYVPDEEQQDQRDEKAAAAPSLPELISGSGLTLPQLIERTGLTAGRLVDLRRGAQARHDEVRAVATAIGSAIEPVAMADSAAFNMVMTEVSAPRWRPARAAWTRENLPGGNPDDPTLLAEWLLHERVAARSVADRQSTGDDVDAVRAYWRDRVAMLLAAFS